MFLKDDYGKFMVLLDENKLISNNVYSIDND